MILIEKTIVMLMGIQGAGKTTFCKMYLSDYEYVNLDILGTREKEEKLVKNLFKAGKSFVVDNTNRYKSDRQRYIPLAIYYGYRIAGYYFEPDLESSIKRNSERERIVPEDVIRKYYGILLKNKPSHNEGFDELYKVINDDKKMIIKKYKE